MIEVVNPNSGKVIGKYESDTEATLNAKYELLRASDWRFTGYEYRASKLALFARLLAEKSEEAASLMTAEVGKPIQQARGEIKGTLGRLDFFLNHGQQYLEDEVVRQDLERGLLEKITYDPLGVVGNISAWNFPYFVGINVFFPALLAGNAVLYKPSEFCVGTGLNMAELFYQSGIPESAFTVVVGGGDVGAMMCGLPLDGMFFTGSVATGKKIANAVADKMMPVQLELGGKDPVYVCDDVDLGEVVPAIADGAFYNAGQSCCSVERIYVHSKIADAFVTAFCKEVEAFKLGDPEVHDTYIGPLTRPVHVEFLERQVNDAKAKGARVELGGARHSRPGFFEPTVLTQVHHEMEVMTVESFGPIVGIMVVDNDEQAVELMNDTTYGLTAGVFTPNQDRAEDILRQVRSGTAYWNCCDRVSPYLPWTGRQDSGVGYTLSHLGIRGFAKARGWHLRGF